MFYDMIADMESNKKLSPIIFELFLGGRKFNISFVLLSKTYFKVLKVPNKRETQQIESNHSSDIDFKDFIKLYKDYTEEPYSLLVNNTTLS